MAKILIFTTAYLPFIGGAEIAVNELAARMPEHEFVLYTARLSRTVPRYEMLGSVAVHRIGIGVPVVDKILLVLLAPWLALRVRGVSCTWAIMASYGGIAAYFYTWLRPRTRLLLTLQEGDSQDHIRRRAGMFYFLVKKIFRRANAVQTISTYLAAWARETGYSGDHIAVIPNGVDVAGFARTAGTDRARIRQELDISPDVPVVITISRLVEKNGVRDLIAAMSELPSSFVCVCVGAGELEAQLHAQAKPLGERVKFVGEVPHAQLPSYLVAADVFCRPSLSEGMGNVFLEAMAAGVPVVATNVGGIPDIVHDEETGILCPRANPTLLARAIERVATDSALREHLITHGREMVASYDWDRVADRFRAFLQTVCAS